MTALLYFFWIVLVWFGLGWLGLLLAYPAEALTTYHCTNGAHWPMPIGGRYPTYSWSDVRYATIRGPVIFVRSLYCLYKNFNYLSEGLREIWKEKK